MTYKTARLNIKVLDSDKNALRQWAKSEGEAVSVLVRQILREELKRRGFLPLSEPFQQKESDEGVPNDNLAKPK